MNKTICLNMIVKDESHIIIRLLESVISIIDTFCICDTGSNDNTTEIIKNYFKDKNIKGKLIYKKFENFEITRNYSLKEAQNMADFILLLDADMIVEISKDFDKNKLDKDYYLLFQGNNNFFYYNTRLISNNNKIKYIGVTHEYIDCPPGIIGEKLNTIKIIDIGDGGSKSNKFERDIKLFEQDLENNSNNIRSLFYLANSYYDIGNFSKAISNYEKHAKIANWNEELFYNYYRQGLCYKNLNNIEKMIELWLQAWATRPTRVESLYEIIHYYRCNCKWNYCKLFYEIAKNIPYPKDDILFVHNDIYEYKLPLEYTIFAFYIGDRDLYSTFSKLILRNEINIGNFLHNYKFYCPQLEYIDSICFNKSIIRTINKEYNFRSSTPSIISFDNNYIMNIRYVNYNIQDNGNYDWVDNIISINKKYILSENFNILEEFEPNFNYSNRKYEGIEDIKLLKSKDEIIFCGTCYKENSHIGMAIGNYSNDKITYNELIKEPEQYCEKNWSFLPCGKKMVYKWFPLQIGFINNNKLEIIQENNMPNIFQEVRGSTNSSLYKDEIWFIVHLVHKYANEPRIYYHMFIKFDINMNLLAFTCPFKFSKEPIEFTCGLIIEEERIIVSHSIWDRESYIKIYNKKYIEKLLIYI